MPYWESLVVILLSVLFFSSGIALDSASIVELDAGSHEFQQVNINFQQKWAPKKGSCPTLSFVFVVRNSKLEKRWRNYRQKLTIQDVEECYHGTVLMCDISNTKTMCSNEDCGICGISKDGFDHSHINKNVRFQRLGVGFYLAPDSSKCHDYTQGFFNHRAMLLCDVCPGKKYVVKQDDMTLEAPPQGYDSVHGRGGSDSSFNYDELVTYNPDSILPRYVVVYQKNGIHKIAQNETVLGHSKLSSCFWSMWESTSLIKVLIYLYFTIFLLVIV